MNNQICQNHITQTYLTQNLILKSQTTDFNFYKKTNMNYFAQQKTTYLQGQHAKRHLEENSFQSGLSKTQDHSGAKSYMSDQTTYSTPTSVNQHEKSPIELDFDQNETKLQNIQTQKSQSQIQNIKCLQYQNQSKQNTIGRKHSEIIQLTYQNQKIIKNTPIEQQCVKAPLTETSLPTKIKIDRSLQIKTNYFFMRPTIYKCAINICEKIRMSRQVCFMAMQLIDQYYAELLCPYDYSQFVSIFYGCTIIASKVVSKKILNTPFVARTIKKNEKELIQLQFKLIKFFKYKVYRQTFVMRLGNYLQGWNRKCPQMHLFQQNIESFSMYYKIIKLLEECACNFDSVCDMAIKEAMKKVFQQKNTNQNLLQSVLQSIFDQEQKMIEESLQQKIRIATEKKRQFVQTYILQPTSKIAQVFQLRKNTQKYPTYTIFLNCLF